MITRSIKTFLVLFLLLIPLPAQGYQGFGSPTTGHEETGSWTTVTVSNCNATGAGSLRDAVQGTGKGDRYVKFSVGPCTIDLEPDLSTDIHIDGNNVTIDGFNATGLITIDGRGFRIDGVNVIVRNIYVTDARECTPSTTGCDPDGDCDNPGTCNGGNQQQGNCFVGKNDKFVISFVGCKGYTDQAVSADNLGANPPAARGTVENSYLGPALGTANTAVFTGCSGADCIDSITIVRNVFYPNNPGSGGDRNPKCNRKDGTLTTCDIVNNLVMQWRTGSGLGTELGNAINNNWETRANVIGNYYYNSAGTQANNENAIEDASAAGGFAPSIFYTADNFSQFSATVTDTINALGNEAAPLDRGTNPHATIDACTAAHWLLNNVGPKPRPAAIQTDIDTLDGILDCVPRRFVRRR